MSRPRQDPSPRHWRGANWLLVTLLAGVALLLGWLGFARRLPDGTYDASDSLIRAIQLFVLEGSGLSPPVPWQLEIARYLAPAVTVYAAVVAALSVFLNEARRIAQRIRRGGHIVVCGGGSKGVALIRHLRGEGHSVTVIEAHVGNPALPGLRERGVVVLTGDARDERILRKAYVDRADSLIAACGDDGSNLEIALAAGRLAGPSWALTAHVNVDDWDLLQALRREEVGSGLSVGARLDFFSVWEAAARRLAEADARLCTAPAEAHVLILGVGPPCRQLVLHCARMWRNLAAPGLLPLTLAGEGAGEFAATLRLTYADLEQLVELRVLDEVRDLTEAGAAPAGPPVTSVYIRAEREAQGLASALALRRHPGLVQATITLVVDDESQGPGMSLPQEEEGGRIGSFGVINHSLTSDLLAGGTHQEFARTMHENYVRTQSDLGESPATNPSLVSWDELPEPLKQSNRRYADAVAAKLAELGCAVIANPLTDPARARLPVGADDFEQLARAEHDRWSEDLRADGWRHTDGPKDSERKLHPNLVPWGELTEDDREKDRQAVRALPRILARAGFELRGVSRHTPHGVERTDGQL